MGSHIDSEELERLADTMDRDVLIKTIKIGFGIAISSVIYMFFFN